MLIGQGRELDVAAALGQRPRSARRADARVVDEPQAAVIEPLDVVTRRHIEAALQHTHGRVDGPHGAARLLRINPHTLRSRMRKLGVQWKGFRARAT